MKLKVKITGYSEGKRRSIIRTIETPDFVEREVTFLGRTWTEKVISQQIDWVDDNYFEVVIPLAEEEWLHPIEGFVAIEPKVKIDKRQLVIDYADVLLKDWSIESKEVFLVSLTKQWQQIKGLSIENIFKIVFNTIDVSSAVAGKNLQDIINILNSGKKESPKLLK